MASAAADVPVAFVVPETPGTMIDALRTLDVHRDWRQFVRGPWIWCLQTYLELRQRGSPVLLTHEPVAGSINLVHIRQLYELDPDPGTFIVSIRADCPDIAPWTPVNIVQNRRQADGRRSFWIPHWPQPGLLPRSSSRTVVRCAAYTGHQDWLAGTEPRWRKELASLGMEFRWLRDDCWNDYSDIDVLIAVRRFDPSPFDNKPPTKLINAWHGRVPLVAGFDSAFAQIGRPGRHYLQVDSWKQARDALRTLRDDPVQYRSLVEAGAAAGRKFSRDRIARAWQDLLAGPVREQFELCSSSRPRAASARKSRRRTAGN